MAEESPKHEPGPPEVPENREPPLISTASPPSGPPGGKRDNSGCGALILGAILCVVLLIMLGLTGNWMLCLVGTPAVGVAMTVGKGTRGVGLGILITYGFLGIVFLAICGRGMGRM
jgi:hypothetical protein